MFHNQTYLVFQKNVCFIVPQVRCVRPLQWIAKEQRFNPIEDEEECQTLQEYVDRQNSVNAVTTPEDETDSDQNGGKKRSDLKDAKVLKCEALYGVLQIGCDDCALVFVTACKAVGTFSVFREQHIVNVVQKMKWIRLPRRPNTDANGAGTSAESDGPSSTTSSLTTRKPSAEVPMSEEFTDDFPPYDEQMKREYFSILNNFCRSVETESCFYFCSTLNLAYSPLDLLSSSGSAAVDISALNTPQRVWERHVAITTFQWNHMLLNAFDIPQRLSCTSRAACPEASRCPAQSVSIGQLVAMRTTLANEDEEVDSSASGEEQGGSGSLPSMQTWKWHQRTFSESAGVHPFHSQYVPAFIRGYFGTAREEDTKSTWDVRRYVMTRWCCQWAGTRLNRLGLEPGSSGVCANMGVSSVWLVSEGTDEAKNMEMDKLTNAATSAPCDEKKINSMGRRIAVYEVLRGSIPRRFEQRANLSICPSVRLLSKQFRSTPLEEFTNHMHLVKHILPGIKHLMCVNSSSIKMCRGGASAVLDAAYREGVEQFQEEQKRQEQSKTCCGGAGLDAGERRTITSTSGGSGALPIVLYLNVRLNLSLPKRRFTAVQREILEKCKRMLSDEKDDEWALAASSNFTQWEESFAPDDQARKRQGLIQLQSTYYRLSSEDSVDDVSVIQSCIVAELLPSMLTYVDAARWHNSSSHDISAEASHIKKSVLELLSRQGQSISILYYGTMPKYAPYTVEEDDNGSGVISLSAPFTSVKRFFHMSMRRWYQQNFLDGSKQDGISLLTLQHGPPDMYGSVQYSSTWPQDYSKMNFHVLYGLVCAGLPSIYSFFAFLLADESRNHHGLFAVLWLFYLVYIYTKIREAGETLASQPRLLYFK